jgi:sporulation protein YtfJ
MSEHPIEGMMDTTLEKIKQMVDVNSVIGDPITAPDGTVIIPVSKVNYGFASGGSDLPVKTSEKQFFGGGTGAGVTITPVAFLVVSNGDIRLMRVELGSTPVDRIIDQAPELINRIGSMVGKKKKDNTTVSDGTENSPAQE